MRSRNDSPGRAEICTTISSDSTRVPPVTAERSPPDSRTTGADSPVIADSSIEAMPSTTSPSPGMTSPARTTQRSPTASAVDGTSSIDAVAPAPAGDGLAAGLAQRRRLGLAAALGHGLGEVGEQHGEPQPRRHQPGEAVGVADGEDRGQDAADLDDEHHRVAGLDPGVELAEAVEDRRPHDRRVEQRSAGEGVAVAGVVAGLARRRLVQLGSEQAHSDRCSTIGPRARAGKNVRPATIRTTPATSPANSGLVVGKRAGGDRDVLLAHERAADGQHRDEQEEPAEQHRRAERRVHPLGVGRQPGERRAVVVAGRGERVEHLGEPVGAGVLDRRRSAPCRARPRSRRGSAPSTGIARM